MGSEAQRRNLYVIIPRISQSFHSFEMTKLYHFLDDMKQIQFKSQFLKLVSPP
jgi:hypothetical protein